MLSIDREKILEFNRRRAGKNNAGDMRGIPWTVILPSRERRGRKFVGYRRLR
jgi:hypothetical protein